MYGPLFIAPALTCPELGVACTHTQTLVTWHGIC